MIRLDLLDVGLIEETGDILLVLRSPELARLLIIQTGLLEGQAVAMEAEGIRAERPMTQDLMYEMLLRLGARVQEVRIADFQDDAYYARLVLTRPNGGTPIELDARPSDAIALALKARAPIYAAADVLERMGTPENRDGPFAQFLADEEEPVGDGVLH